MAFGRSDKAVSIAFEGKDNVSPVVRGIRSTMDGLKKDAKQGFGLAAGFSVMQMGAKAAGAVVDVLGNMQGAYSDLNEAQTKNAEVFKSTGRLIEAWAEDAADSFGLSERAAIDAASSIGNFMQALGVTEMDAASMSMAITGLAGDLASFNNVAGGAEEVLVSLRSGLAGEAEPMRRLGVDISAAAVEAKALAMGLAETKDQITQSMKVQARFAIIMEQTATAQGDFARTADGSANQSRLLDAKVENLNARMGGFVDTVVRGTQEVTIFAVDAIGGLMTAIDNLDGSVDRANFDELVMQQVIPLLQQAVEDGIISIEQLPEAVNNVADELARSRLQEELTNVFSGDAFPTLDDAMVQDTFADPAFLEEYFGVPFEVIAETLLTGRASLDSALERAFGPGRSGSWEEVEDVFMGWLSEQLAPMAVEAAAEQAGDEAADAVAAGLVESELGRLEGVVPEHLQQVFNDSLSDGVHVLMVSAARDIDANSIATDLGATLNPILSDIFTSSMDGMDSIFGGFGGRISGDNAKTKRGKGSLYAFLKSRIKMEKNNVRDLKRDPQLLADIQTMYDEHATWMNEQMAKLGDKGNALGLMYTGPLATSAQTAADNIRTIGTTAAIAFAEEWGPAWNENVDPLIKQMFEGTAEADSNAQVTITYSNQGLLERMLLDPDLKVTVEGVLDGKRASGGPVKAGGTYLVGEQGPELLHMGANRGGYITPNGQLGGGGMTVVLDGRVVGQIVDERLGRGLIHRGSSSNVRST